eukprot:s315_g6.t1
MAQPAAGNGGKDAKRRRCEEIDGVRPSFMERFFAKYETWSSFSGAEFTCKYMVSCSDCEAWTTREVLATADAECQKMWDSSALGYTEPPPRRAYLRITTCVPVEGIFAAMTSLLSEGDQIVTMMPAYQALYEIARSKRCRLLNWAPYFDQQGFWEFRLSDLQTLLDQKLGL